MAKSISAAALSLGTLIAMGWAGAAASAPADRGKLLFLRCASCHNISETASPKIGPNLAGVFGRHAGSLPGYTYSKAMAAQTFTWDENTLDRWLAKPTEVVPGTAMAFVGISNKADRTALIAYLRHPNK